MSEARRQVLGSIAKALGRSTPPEADGAAVAERLSTRPRGPIPARTRRPPAELTDLFVTMATEVSASVDRVDALDAVPAVVAEYLARHNLPARVRVATDTELAGVPWEKQPTLEVGHGAAEDDDLTSVTGAFAGVAETGTLVLLSGPQRPTTLNFMPDNHVVVLFAERIVAAYEDAWDLVRAAGALPRTVNMITGPSRTGDIEQRIQLGAHGPRRLHIVLVGAAGIG